MIWENIRRCEGETFYTVRGVEYQYAVYSDFILINDDMRRKITKQSLETVVTIDNPSPSTLRRNNVWGPSYVYGIISDERIKSN